MSASLFFKKVFSIIDDPIFIHTHIGTKKQRLGWGRRKKFDGIKKLWVCNGGRRGTGGDAEKASIE